MKSILISIRPEWVAKILSGYKTIEVRKTKPNCEFPVKVYIYCTKGNILSRFESGEFLLSEDKTKKGYVFPHALNGKVVAEFTLNKVSEIKTVHRGYEIDGGVEALNDISKKSGLDFLGLRKYLDYKTGYAWHIEDLVIYKEPKELKEFNLNTAPQSWFYVEERL